MRYGPRAPGARPIRKREETGQGGLADLVERYLDELLAGLAAQTRYASTKEFVESQSGADLALLHGVMCDRAFRLLTAMAAAQQRERDQESGAPTIQ